MSEGCVFCDQSWMREAETFIETPHWGFASTRDPDTGQARDWQRASCPAPGQMCPSPTGLRSSSRPPRSGPTPGLLLLQARMALHDLLAPDGYLLGWNQGGVLHPHMHVIPRFDDEPLSDRWLRSAINAPEKQTTPSMGARERMGTSGCQVSEAPGASFKQGSLHSGQVPGEQKGADGDHGGSRTPGHRRGGGRPCPAYPPWRWCPYAGVDDGAVGGVHQAQQRDLGRERPGRAVGEELRQENVPRNCAGRFRGNVRRLTTRSPCSCGRWRSASWKRQVRRA